MSNEQMIALLLLFIGGTALFWWVIPSGAFGYLRITRDESGQWRCWWERD